MSVACGVEQSAVLPTIFGLGVAVCAVCAYRAQHGTFGRERQWRKRRAGELLGVEEASPEPKALGKSVAPSVEKKEELASCHAARAIHEDRVVLLDRDGYLEAKAQLRYVSGAFLGACLAAVAQPGGADMVFAALRLLFLALLAADFAFTAGGQLGGGLLSVQRQGLRKVPLLGREAKEDLLVSSLGLGAWPLERLRLALLQVAGLGLLLWFEVFRHPALRKSACGSEGAAALLAERGSALTMVLAWLLGSLARVTAWRCEACVWLAPRAEELLAEYLETERGFPLRGALDLAENLCGAHGESWLRELRSMSLLVMDGSSQLRACNGLAQLQQLGEVQRDLHAEVRRLSQMAEARFEELQRTHAAAANGTAQVLPRAGAETRSSRRSSKASREELLKTKLDQARGAEVRAKPSDSGESSSSPRAVDASSTAPSAARHTDVSPRVRADLAQGGALARLMEQALQTQRPEQKAQTPREEFRSVGSMASVGSSERSMSQGSRRGPKRYSELRKITMEQRAAAKASQWKTLLAPAPPSPPWNVQSVSSPLGTARPASPQWSDANEASQA
ncbi:unnamed protein product [Effrenium voratum]|uniref:Uncharacterized protein n=1 Tax=Effrenium voratum TaxID=2562239 RepID=A0AA36NDG3_9DINO|nr:unnamed protein product [Effrenium voratum]